MKFVTLAVMAIMISFGAASQTTRTAPQKSAVTQVQQKKKVQKAKSSKTKLSASKKGDVTTLTDEKAYKAKWSFEQMLLRRLEIDAEESERQSQQRID